MQGEVLTGKNQQPRRLRRGIKPSARIMSTGSADEVSSNNLYLSFFADALF